MYQILEEKEKKENTDPVLHGKYVAKI